ncbi:hypothetical protein [Nocardia africana]
MSNPAPTVGRIVHFQTYGTPGGEHASEPIAAIITGVREVQYDPTLPVTFEADLFAIYPNGTSHKTSIPFAEEPTPGHWNWPPRV